MTIGGPYMTPFIRGITTALLLCLLLSGPATAEPDKAAAEKRDQVRRAIDAEVLSPYAIPFHAYVNLEMWEELRFILDANNDLVTRRRLPGLYYSRPYAVGDEVWVFENTTVGAGDVHIFDPESLAPIRTLEGKATKALGGTIREAVNATVISGGGDEDVDAVAVWNTKTDATRTVRLKNGHYVGAAAATGDRLLVGACGGLVNVWTFPDLTFAGRYFSSEQENVNWDVFNQKECISAVAQLKGDAAAGAGENSVFIWNRMDAPPVRRVPKAMPGSIALFHGSKLVEHRKTTFTVTDLATGDPVGTVETDREISDLIVTEEPILPDAAGAVIVLTLRQNKGLLFYDFETLAPLRRLDAKGETVSAFHNAVFATDDRNLYRFGVRHWEPAKYDAFIAGIRPEEIVLTAERYDALIDLLKDFPDALAASGVPERYMAAKGISVSRSFNYGRIDAGPGAAQEETRYGYKAAFEVENRSGFHYLVTLSAAWSGAFGGGTDRTDGARHPDGPVSFFLSPDGGRYAGQFGVGEKEPARLVLYPTRLAPVTADFRDGLTKALSLENDDMDLVDRYLEDDRVSAWHDELNRRRSELAARDKGFWLFRIFR